MAVKDLKKKLADPNLDPKQAARIKDRIKYLGGKVPNQAAQPAPPPQAQPAPQEVDPAPDTADVVAATNEANPVKAPGSVYKADVAAEQDESQKQINYQNPDYDTALGSSRTTINPDGTVNVKHELSQNQADILAGGEGLTKTGQAKAAEALGGFQTFQGGYSPEDRQRIEGDVYNRLMTGAEDDYKQVRGAKEQELYNKGIPYSEDPNSRYQRELGDIDRRFDEQKLAARGQATMMGGDEMQRGFGMSLQGHQQGLSDIGALQGMGSGLLLPNLPGYSGPQYDVADPSSYIYKGEEIKQGRKVLNQNQQQIDNENAIANKQLAMAGGGGGGAPSAPAFP